MHWITLKNKILTALAAICLFACCQGRQDEISSILSELRDGDLVARTYFFYPSIMRVLNLKDNPDYYQLIRNVNKLVVYMMKDEFGVGDIEQLKTRLQDEEQFEEYASVSLKGQRIYFLGKEDPNQSVLMVPTEDEYFIADIAGQINFWSLNQLVQRLSADSSTMEEDFLDVFSLLGIQKEEVETAIDSISVDSLGQDTMSERIIEE